jgi:hypothetical protein
MANPNPAWSISISSHRQLSELDPQDESGLFSSDLYNSCP